MLDEVVQLGTVMPIVDGKVTTLNGGETFEVAKILDMDSEEFMYFCGDLGGPDFGFPWPGGDFGFTVSVAVQKDGWNLLVVVTTDLSVDTYLADGFNADRED